MQYIGKLDRLKLGKEYANKLLTDKVYMSPKQKIHIEQRHPQIITQSEKYFEIILMKPDYILKDKVRRDTMLFLKKIEEKNNKLWGINLVIKLAVKGELIYTKNSIITCIPIGKCRIKSYKNNREIIYKKE